MGANPNRSRGVGEFGLSVESSLGLKKKKKSDRGLTLTWTLGLTGLWPTRENIQILDRGLTLTWTLGLTGLWPTRGKIQLLDRGLTLTLTLGLTELWPTRGKIQLLDRGLTLTLTLGLTEPWPTIEKIQISDRGLAYIRDCHCQYCMVYCIHKGVEWGSYITHSSCNSIVIVCAMQKKGAI